MASSSSRGQRDGRHVRMDTTGAGRLYELGDLILRKSACHGRVSFLPANLYMFVSFRTSYVYDVHA